MENGAKGCEVIVSVKLRAQRAMKFEDGYMISSGQPVNEYIDSAVRHVLLRQLKSCSNGIRRESAKQGPPTPLLDLVTIHPPKDEDIFVQPPVLTTNMEVPVSISIPVI
ncbi:40S ribosomal protein S3-3 isoform X2 [Beta vulgaris subsp. vulgaris]|nr:40S ribosomal protein S3-3 isoform X2 [Beta vulgaris subsp. vulgaris]